MSRPSAAFPPLVEPGRPLDSREAERYSRHLALPNVGLDGQRRLRAASVLVIGAGGLGAPTLQYLAAAGIGSITVIDHDVVEASNLQRQIIHRSEDIGRAKVESARDAVLRLDPHASVTALRERLSPENALELFARHDVVLDGADNFATRYLSNDAAELTGTPLVWGTIFRFAGQVSTFWPGHGPMLRDLFPDVPDADSVPNCAEGGVLGVLCGTVGSAMATEAVKLICGIGAPLVGRLLRYDALTADYSTLAFDVDPDRPAVTSLDEIAVTCAIEACQADAAEDSVPDSDDPDAISAAELQDLLTNEPTTEGPVIVDVRDDWERAISAIPGSVHVPLADVQSRGWDAVAPACGENDELVLYCKAGVRSIAAREALARQRPDGIRIRSLTGGIDAWAELESAEHAEPSGSTASRV